MNNKRGRRRQRSGGKIYSTTVADETIRGTAKHIVAKCEALGYEAERRKDDVTANLFFQTADHYKRIEDHDRHE